MCLFLKRLHGPDPILPMLSKPRAACWPWLSSAVANPYISYGLQLSVCMHFKQSQDSALRASNSTHIFSHGAQEQSFAVIIQGEQSSLSLRFRHLDSYFIQQRTGKSLLLVKRAWIFARCVLHGCPTLCSCSTLRHQSRARPQQSWFPTPYRRRLRCKTFVMHGEREILMSFTDQRVHFIA
jgi:hypothetical protein